MLFLKHDVVLPSPHHGARALEVKCKSYTDNFVILYFPFHAHIAYRLDSIRELKWQLLHMIDALILVFHNF